MLPWCSLPATLAFIGTISDAKARAVRCSSLPSCAGQSLPRRHSSRARSRIGREKGERADMEGTELWWLVACRG